ncbi:hypothetical protein J6W78_07980 [bacterium]|nr:hypothetical protein [bacterium]
MIKSETFDSGTVSSAIAWNPTTKVMSETITLPSGKNIVETTLKGLPETLEYDGSKLLQYNYGTGNVLSSIHKNFDSNNNHAAELSYTYNDWRKVSRRKEDFTSLNTPTVADYEYTYSKGLHLIGKQENEENRRTAYQYDSYYRLRRVDYDCDYTASDPTCIESRNNVFKCDSSETDCEDFQLDGVHNIMASRENQTDFTWTVDGFNRLTEKSWNSNRITYSYDSNNNLVSEDFDGSNPPEIVYTYDKLNRLTSVTNSDYFVEYSYDPFNRRTEKTVYYTENSDTYEETHKYAYDGWDIISEEIKTVRTSDTPATTVTWQLRRYVDQGTDNHIIMDTVSCSDDGNGNCSPNEPTLQRIWFHKDERGNVIAISNGNGTIYERYRYRVYGEHEVLNADFTPKSTAALSPFLWGGSLYEPETNLYWMRNRYYHIDMHRFINQDPIGIWGDANNLGNGFAYVAGMVIEASDPSGLDVTIVGDDLVQIIENACKNSDRASAIFAFLNADDSVNVTIYSTSSDSIIDYDIDEETGERIPVSLQDMGGAVTISKESGSIEIIISKDIVKSGKANAVSGEIDAEAVFAHEGSHAVDIANKKSSKKTKDLEEAYAVAMEVEAQDELDEAKKNEEEKKDKGGEKYPSDPDNSNDSHQQKLMESMLSKILRNSDFSIYEQGPVVKIQVETASGNPKWVFVFNPFYKGKDPMKQIFWKTKNADGTNGFVRNPFAPGAEYGYDATTYEKFQQSGFPQTNVDPYFE